MSGSNANRNQAPVEITELERSRYNAENIDYCQCLNDAREAASASRTSAASLANSKAWRKAQREAKTGSPKADKTWESWKRKAAYQVKACKEAEDETKLVKSGELA